jgi:hypothetical protein
LDLRLINGCVHPGYAEPGYNCLSKSNKASFIEKNPWMSLLELDGTLAMFSTHDGIVIDVYVMHDYKAEVWALVHQINQLALEASPQLDLPARTVREIATLTMSVNC